MLMKFEFYELLPPGEVAGNRQLQPLRFSSSSREVNNILGTLQGDAMAALEKEFRRLVDAEPNRGQIFIQMTQPNEQSRIIAAELMPGRPSTHQRALSWLWGDDSIAI
jgi:hypothetical protein